MALTIQQGIIHCIESLEDLLGISLEIGIRTDKVGGGTAQVIYLVVIMDMHLKALSTVKHMLPVISTTP